MRSRWKVERESDWLNGTYWVAWQPDKGWRALAPKFHTHDDALAYADRMARTIQATLPRVGRQTQIPVPEDYGNERPISVSDHGDFISVTFTAQGLTQDVAIHPEELEPLALTLLTLSRKDTTHDH